MLPVEKNNDIISQIQRVIGRSDHIREVKDQLFHFINGAENLNSTFAVKINKQMTKFEEFVVKISLYYEKSDHIINLSKLYREFSLQIERNSKINLLNLQKIKQETIVKQQQKLRQKCQKSTKQFQGYIHQQRQYNGKYSVYNSRCEELTQIISRYKSYENPISFYNKILTNEYLSQLQKKNHECSTTETQIITNRQMIDEKRGFLTETIKEVNQHYFVLIHNYLVTIETIIKCIVFPKTEEKLDKTELNLRMSDNIEEQHMMELQRLDNLYATETGQKGKQESPFEQFSQLFRKSVNQFEINSDYRFFHDRCDSIRSKKLKTSEQSFKIQEHLMNELRKQLESYENYDREYRRIEKDTFTNNGIESYKKRFRKYFGSNFTQIFELCLNLIERQKKSLEKISKNMEESQLKMMKILQNKKQSIDAFDRRSQVILQDHLKLKERVILKQGSVNSAQLQTFKSNISDSFNSLKKIFLQLQKSESQDDKRFYSSMKSLYEAIMKEATHKNLNKLLQKQKNRITILNNMNINHEILLILKQDSRYQTLLNQCPKPNLYSTFVSQIQKRQVEDTRILLQKKQQRLKGMVKPKQGCCGIKSEVMKLNIHSQHKCKLLTEEEKHKGVLNVSSNGLIFQENTWFSQGLQLIIPQTDLKEFGAKTVNEKEVLEVQTQFGLLTFQSSENQAIEDSMHKNITFKGVRENSEVGKKQNQSSTVLKGNTSSQWKLSFEKSMSNGDLSKILKNDKSNIEHRDGKVGAHKHKSLENTVRDLIRKWKDAQFFSQEKFVRKQTKRNHGYQRRDYDYHNGHSKFYLKQRRQYRPIQKDLVFRYQWKISFPQSPMLHSFKHHQQVKLQNISKELTIRIVTAKYYQQQLYIKNKFYKEIEEMNKLLCQFVVYNLEKEADIVNDQEDDEKKSGESFNILLDDINLEERDSKFQRTDSNLRNSKIQRKSILVPNSGNKIPG